MCISLDVVVEVEVDDTVGQGSLYRLGVKESARCGVPDWH